MTLYIKHEDGTITTATVTLQPWDGNQWGCDFFADAEINLRDGQEITAADLQEVIDYWSGEVDAHNAGEYTEQFGDPDGVEYGFFVEETARSTDNVRF